MKSPSLLWKILLSTGLAITLLLGVAGYLVERRTRALLMENLESELNTSFRAYESLWKSRADTLRSVSSVLSTMSDVRAAFQTNDRATIRDTAAEIWSRASASAGLFLVTDPSGDVIASLGGGDVLGDRLAPVKSAAESFPRQSAGFWLQNGSLYELVVTPVYVQAQDSPALLNVLVAGFPVTQQVANDLKDRTGGSDFVFVAGGVPVASTLAPEDATRIAASHRRGAGLERVRIGSGEMAVLDSTLTNLEGAPAGDLLILRSSDAVHLTLASLESNLLAIWIAAVLGGLTLSAFLAHRILQPIRRLDEAAGAIARQEYGARVPEGGTDEIGRLARTFNAMSGSIQQAREELIRQERISTIGRLATSIVHDLRNPLASIFGGAEMLMDGQLSETQTHRLAGNIYRSSRAVNSMLQDLVSVSRGDKYSPEPCRLEEVIAAAVDTQAAAAEQHGIQIAMDIDSVLELPLERARMERVFINLIGNSIEAMYEGGEISLRARRDGDSVLIEVDDNGPGIDPAVRPRLFEPFASARRKGAGLGLALSRQTVIDHGGNLWAENVPAPGAHFRIRLPLPAN